MDIKYQTFWAWMSQQDDLCKRPIKYRWHTEDLEKAYNAGMEAVEEAREIEKKED